MLTSHPSHGLLCFLLLHLESSERKAPTTLVRVELLQRSGIHFSGSQSEATRVNRQSKDSTSTLHPMGNHSSLEVSQLLSMFFFFFFFLGSPQLFGQKTCKRLWTLKICIFGPKNVFEEKSTIKSKYTAVLLYTFENHPENPILLSPLCVSLNLGLPTGASLDTGPTNPVKTIQSKPSKKKNYV